MQTKDLLFLWGVVASLVLLADGSTIPSAGRVAAKFEGKGFVNLPNLDAPTEKEWLEIIEGTHRGEPVPRYLAERNYTFHVNETGEFSTSDGFKGHWNQTEYLHYRVVGDQSHRVVFHIEDIHLGHLHLGVAQKSVATFTATGNESYVSATAVGGMTFVKENDTWAQGGSFLGFGQGQGIIGELRTTCYSWT
ncbi:uncharacterized protein LOC135223857 [Macrobrachium nipponense]|uniref:uncharacterized protein LOC135223857 n=1 Tax=Macrobrachium nipponense TaxID=159736 RepID=UPI0030C7BF06